MIYYLDTSALIKRYLNETGSQWIRDLTEPTAGHLFITSRLTTVEASSAFARRLHEGSVTPAEHADNLDAFTEDRLTLYHLVELRSDNLDLARDLVLRQPLRTLDALQLAAALVVNRLFANLNLPSLIFLSADDHLLRIAQAEGLPTDNPSRHP